MGDADEQPWATAYSEKDLEETIKRAAKASPKNFYFGTTQDEATLQGDIILLPADLPFLDEAGQPAVQEQVVTWLVVANTCDLDRTLDDVTWAPLVPIYDMQFERAALAALRDYATARRFFLPAWKPDQPDLSSDRAMFADLTRSVHIHRTALKEVARREARMSREAWILLNSCMIRYHARADGRHVPTS